MVGRALVANRWLAGSARGKRRGVRPLNLIVRTLPSVDMPAQVRKAVMLLWVTLLISIIATPLEIDWAASSDEPAWLFWLLFVVGYSISAIPIVFVARRRNWARIVLLLLTIAALCAMVYVWPYTDSWWSQASDMAIFALDIVALYWLFTGSGAAWFAKRQEGAF